MAKTTIQKEKKPKTVMVESKGKWGELPRERHGYVFEDAGSTASTESEWNWAAVDPKNGKVVAEGHGFNTKGGATVAIKREIAGLTQITYAKHGHK